MQRVLLIGLVALASASMGDELAEPTCDRPSRPDESVAQALWDAFLADLDAYRQCMSDYIARNNAASDSHRRAANRATDVWNDFVHAELNVPEDFPWPPKSHADGQRAVRTATE